MILFWFKMNISDFIHQNYDVIHHNQACPLEECSTFLLGEIHENVGIRKTNALFIKTFGGENSVVLLECEKSLQPPKFSSEMRQVFGIEIEQMMGWDDDSVAMSGDSLKLAFRFAGIVIDKIPNFGRDLISTNWEEAMLGELKKYSETDLDEEGDSRFSIQAIESSRKQEVRNDSRPYEEQIRILAGKLRGLEASLIKTIQSQVAEINPQIEAIKGKKAELSRLNREINDLEESESVPAHSKELDLKSLNASWMKLQSKKTSLLNAFIPDLKKTLEDCLVSYLRETSLARTEAMVSTLRKIKKVSGKIFLIAGMDHLKEEPDFPPEYSLKSLKGLLDERSDIVILRPKSQDW